MLIWYLPRKIFRLKQLFCESIPGPFNKSGEWTGAMGDVVNDNYPVSVNTWAWLVERDPLVDFVPILKESFILTTISKKREIDVGLYIRPFR